MQVYSKEKIRSKKQKVDKSDTQVSTLRSALSKTGCSTFINPHNYNSGDKNDLIKNYFHHCEKYGFPQTLNKDKQTIVRELEFIYKNEMNKKLKNNKNKTKKTNVQIISDALGSDDSYKIRQRFFKDQERNKDEIKKSAEMVFGNLNNVKKLFGAMNLKNIFIFDALIFISRNSDLWIKRDYDFTSKSKNIEKKVLELFNYYFFEYAIQKNELFLCEHEYAMRTFIKTKSMKKVVNKHYSDLGLTKKQINLVKSKKMLVNHVKFKDFLFEIKFNELVKDSFITKEMVFKNDKDFVMEYGHYINNVILKDPMFSKVQIAPLFDYVTLKKNEFRREGKIFTFHNRCLINLFQEMEEWHRRIHISKTKKNLTWDKSVNLLEVKYESFKDKDKHESELRLPHNYSFYEIVELNSSAELKKEGRDLKHCVGSYDRQCYKGESRIFSLRHKGYQTLKEKSVVTIQVNSHNSITQSRGNSNRMPTNAEKNIISKWHSEMML